MNAAVLQARPGRPLKGRVRAPGDKSISHRALILAAMAEGETLIEGLLEGDDVLRTAAAMRAFGAEVERTGPGAWRVAGKGRLEEPTDVVDCGNSGTGVRLIMGAVAGYPIAATFTGDHSLRGRPMARITDPLREMGAVALGRSKGRLPLTLQGGELRTVVYHPPMASAQVKSAVLLAGLNAPGGVTVVEKESTRDHTERMMRAFGAEVETTLHGLGRTIVVKGGQTLRATTIRVPSDPSSAAFPLVGALITPGSEVVAEGVLLNPLRAGLFLTLQEMGADLVIENRREDSGEPIGDLVARYSPNMKGVEVPAERAPSMIDEYPILAIAAAFAEGRTVMNGVGELRVKESDRIALTAGGLEACGVMVEEEPEGLIVTGVRPADHPVRGGSLVETHGDHRIAMAHLVLGLGAAQPVRVDEAGMIATSFPGFRELMAGLGADISEAS